MSIFDPTPTQLLLDAVLGAGIPVMLGTIAGLLFTVVKRFLREGVTK